MRPPPRSSCRTFSITQEQGVRSWELGARSALAGVMVKKLLIAVVVLVVLGGVGAALAVNELTRRVETPYRGYPGSEVFVEVEPGDPTPVIGRRLAEAGVVDNPLTFRLAVWRSGRDRDLQAGEYHFDEALSAMDVVDAIARGRVYLRSITFPEGLTIDEMAEVFGRSSFGEADDFRQAATRVDLVAELDPGASNLEGYLFPETYALPRGATANDLVEAMVTQFLATMTPELRDEVRQRELTVREAVTLASLIEKETGSTAEHNLVSAVYNNRLRIGMLLQCDPTVIYALQQDGLYDGNLTRANLRYDSPYNTYVYGGLPPGPIASPGRAALEAVVAPADVTYLYFVSRNDGTHAFADTLREHNRNVQRFQVEYFRARRRGGNRE